MLHFGMLVVCCTLKCWCASWFVAFWNACVHHDDWLQTSWKLVSNLSMPNFSFHTRGYFWGPPMVQMQGFCILVILCVGGVVEVWMLGQKLPRHYRYNQLPSPLFRICSTILIFIVLHASNFTFLSSRLIWSLIWPQNSSLTMLVQSLFHFLSWLTLVLSLCFTRYMHEVVIFFLEINAYDNLQVEFVVFDTNMP